MAAGALPPVVAENESDAGEVDRAGGDGGATLNVTGIVFGEPATAPAVIVTSVVYVPAGRPVVSGVTVTVPAFVPLAGVSESHGALSEAVQFRVPPPAFDTSSVFAAGLEPPCEALNDRFAGVAARAGGWGAPDLNTTVAIAHGVLATVDTRAFGVSPRLGSDSSTTNSMSEVGETLTRSAQAGSGSSDRAKPESA